MILVLPEAVSSISVLERTTTLPLPVLYASLIPLLPMMIPWVGKSGPFTYSFSSSMVISGSSISANIPSTTSPRLWGGIFVAIPTAIPEDPFTRRLGNLAGRTTGSISWSSKFGLKSTVSLLMSPSNSAAIFVSLDSVYLMAAALSPSLEPKLPWPSIRVYLSEKSCAILTRLSYTAMSPWG